MKHVKQLVHMPQVKGRDFFLLHQLINHVSSHTNALQALNLQATINDLILNHLLLSVLDPETHKEWELHSSKVQDLPSTKEIMEFLEDGCKAMELLQANQVTGTTSPRIAQHTGVKVSQSSRCNLTTQLQCPSCKGPHRLFHCNKFLQLQPQQRYEHAKQVRARFNCLQAFNKNHRCSKKTCRKCGQRHDTLLHIISNKSTNSTNSSQGKGNSVEEVNTYCSIKGKPTTQVMLATAIVEIKNKFNQYIPCRVLLDSA
jgi:hypothetical protein